MDNSSYKEIIDFAIEREEEAAEAYGNLSMKVNTPGLKDLLLELQEEEKNHKRLLEEITEEKISTLETSDVLDLKISDFLVAEPADEDMSIQDLLIFAAKKEQKAVEMYTSLKTLSTTEEMKNLFDFLIEQEKSHKLKLEIEYENKVLEEG